MNRLEWTDRSKRRCHCKVCGSRTKGNLVAHVHTKSGTDFEAVRCRKCGSIDLVDDPLDAMPTDAEIDDYIEAGAGISAIAEAFDGVDRTDVARFLDVGCGYGFAMDIARSRFGWTVVGVEPSLAGQRGAEELGLDIRTESLTPATRLGEPFDLILANEVVEHVVDPLAFLLSLRAHLKPTGTLIVTAPAAEVVTPASAEYDALYAISPGYHTFVPTQEAVTDLLRRAGFTHVDVVRDGRSLRATAGQQPRPARNLASLGERRGLLAYLRERMMSAPAGSSLAVGMSVRLLGELVAAGRLAEADDVATIVRAAFRDRHGLDLSEPHALLERIDNGDRLPWSAVGASYAFGVLTLNLHALPERAADHFALTTRLAAFWMRDLDIVDLTLPDLRFQGAYNRAFAQTRFDPAAAVHSARLLDEHVSPTVPDPDDLLNRSRCRLFVELVAQGHRDVVHSFADDIRGIAAPTARSDTADSQVAGLDALYSLGILYKDAGDVANARSAFVECIELCDSRPMDDEHATRLGRLARATMPRAASTGPEVGPPGRTKRWFRRKDETQRPSDAPARRGQQSVAGEPMTESRIQELRRHIAPNARGVEVGAYHKPITPRSDGFDAIHLDLFDDSTQRERAATDPQLSDEDVGRIETVDLVGSAADIAELVAAKYGDAKVDYVVSSHNLEHLPNPIKFLQGCQQILRPGGVLSLAIPDLRYCFDFYRARTETAEWLEAFAEDRTEPTRAQLFQWVASVSNVNENGSWNADATDFPVPLDLLSQAMDYWTGTVKPDYLDAHCWAFTPASFRLIIEDLRQLGFHQFDVISVSPPQGNEFFAHLRNAPDTPPLPDAVPYAERRAQTMRQMILESGEVVQQFGLSAVDQPAP